MAGRGIYFFFTPPLMGGDKGRVKYPTFLLVTLS